MIHHIFNFCVESLIYISKIFGVSYEEANVWIFCVIWPLLTLSQFIAIVILIRKLKFKQNETTARK